MYRNFLKRILDIVISLGILVFGLPVWLLICILIWLDSPGASPFFVQERVGLNGRTFNMIKFRSMIPDAYKYGRGLYFDGEDDWRITRVGRFLRKTSLDEIPQLLNVLIGDMSLVGPRPMLPYQYEYLSDEQKRRFEVRPGITGLAQVKGRNIIPWSERIEIDIEYVKSMSFLLDLRILVETLAVILNRKGISYDVSKDQVEDFITSKEPGKK